MNKIVKMKNKKLFLNKVWEKVVRGMFVRGNFVHPPILRYIELKTLSVIICI